MPSLTRFASSGFEISANMTPAEDVGGDYYDVIMTPDNRLWFGIIPDISKPTIKYAGEFHLKKNDLLFLYTDGVIEVCNEKREQYDIKRLEAFLKGHSTLPTETIKLRLLAELNQYMHHQMDDITFLILRKK